MARPASAQLLHHDVLVELATLNARQSTGGESSATMGSALARAVWPRLTAEAFAVFVSAPTQDEGNASASQFGARSELRVPKLEFAPIELIASTTRFGALDHGRGSQSTVLGRQHFRRANIGLFAGGGRASVQRQGEAARASNLEVGFWGTRADARSNVTASVSAQRALTTDWQLMESAGYFLTTPARAYEIHDASIELRAQRSRVSAFAVHSWRRGVGATSGSGRVTNAGASLQLLDHWSLSATVGSQLADVLRGLPAAQIRTLSLRWQRAPMRTVYAAPVRDRVRTPVAAADAPLREATLEPSGSESFLVLRIAAAANARVEMAGSFNDWTAIPLAYDGTQFVLRLPLASGAHRIAVRVNGGEWRAVTGLARVDDGLGGVNSLVVVP